LKVSEVGEIMGRKRGRERKARQGGVVSLARLERVCPARIREEGGKYQLFCCCRIATIVMLASYESCQHCAVVLTCL